MKLQKSTDMHGVQGYMTFREPLPRNCPPNDAALIEDPLEVFRIVQSNPPTESDFKSQRDLKPDQRFPVPECTARGLSVFENPESCAKHLKLPKFKRSFLCRVSLTEGAGFIKPTGRDPAHRTWWPFATYDVLSRATVESA